MLQLARYGPSGRGFAAMSFDPATQQLILFGGSTCPNMCNGLNDTWTFSGGTWWTLGTRVTPPGRAAAELAWDPATASLLLFGGASGVSPGLDFNDSWTFSGLRWSPLTLSPAPPPRDSFEVGSDFSGAPLLVFGGLGSDSAAVASSVGSLVSPKHVLNDTWGLELPITTTLAPSTTPIEAGVSEDWTGTVSGGYAPYTASVAFGDGTVGLGTITGAGISSTHAYLKPGTFAAQVTVSDSIGATGSATAPLTVTASLSIVASCSQNRTDVGVSVDCTASAGSTGMAPVTFSWGFGDGSTGSGTTTAHSFAAPGVYAVAVNGSDASGAWARSGVQLVVASLPTVNVSTDSSTPVVGVPTPVTPNVEGGTPPYSYSWNFGDGGTSTAAAPAHVFNATGNFSGEVWVNDSVGSSARQSFVIHVSSPTRGSSTPGSPSVSPPSPSGTPLWFWVGLAIVIAATVGGLLAIAARRRRQSSHP